MKNKILFSMLGCLIGCGPNRDFEDKNIFGSQTVGVTTSTTSGSTSTGGEVEPKWSQDNIGYNVSQELPVWLSWDGYPEGSINASKLTKLPIDEWFDADGSRGIHAILFLTAKYDCAACTKESKELQSKILEWKLGGKGIKVVVLVINSPTNGPPGNSSALQWKSQYDLIDATVVIDPSVTFAVSSTFATPLKTIVDPRTMKVFEVTEGYSGNYDSLEALAVENN